MSLTGDGREAEWFYNRSALVCGTQVEQTVRIARPHQRCQRTCTLAFRSAGNPKPGLPGDLPPFGGELASFELDDVGTLCEQWRDMTSSTDGCIAAI